MDKFNFNKKVLLYGFPISLITLAGVYNNAATAYAGVLALVAVLGRGVWESYLERGKEHTADLTLKHKVEQLEAAISAMNAREKARGW